MNSPSYLYRFLGVALTVVFHLFMIVCMLASEDLDSHRVVAAWHLLTIVLGLPWSVAAIFIAPFTPGLDWLFLAAAVSFNGYLLGWLIDVIFDIGSHGQRRDLAPRRADVLSIEQLIVSEAAMADSHTGSTPS